MNISDFRYTQDIYFTSIVIWQEKYTHKNWQTEDDTDHTCI